MRVLITGASGLLGGYLWKTKPESGEVVVQGTHKHNSTGWSVYLDLEKVGHIVPFVAGYSPDVIIHTAGMGSVDEAEKDATRAHLINCQATLQLAYAARRYNARFIYLSSNAVYGALPPPYNENSVFSPVNTYGFIKAVTEYCLRTEREFGLEVNVVRPIMLYGRPQEGGRGNWVMTCLHKFPRGEPIKAVQDVITQPLYAYDLAKFLWRMVAGLRGDYNIAGDTVCTFVGFAQQVAYVWAYDPRLVEPISSSALVGLAPRPKVCVYDLTAVCSQGYVARPLLEGLKEMRDEVCAEDVGTGLSHH